MCDYTGKYKSTEEWNSGNEGDYGLHLTKNLVLDARSTQSAIGRYANNCRNSDKKKNNCKGRNAKFVINQSTKTVSIKATKNIPAHSEIFISYGTAYWK